MMLKIIGNVVDVLEGKVLPRKLLPISGFQYALGAGTFSDEHCVGETIVIDGVVHVSWVENETLHTQSGTKALTPFLMGVTKMEGPVIRRASCTLETLYEELLEEHPEGVAIAGDCLMKEYRGIYLKRAPIHHENINENRDRYWSAVETHQNVFVQLFAVIMEKGPSLGFYRNPMDKGQKPFDHHTHAKLESGVRHTLIESIVDQGKFTISPLRNITNI